MKKTFIMYIYEAVKYDFDEYFLVGCGTVYSGRNLAILHLQSRRNSFLRLHFDIKDSDSTFFRKVGRLLPYYEYMASQSGISFCP
jgi:hypothetical protein